MSAIPGFLKTTDFAAFQGMRDAARFIVFHHPELLTLDPGVAAKILGYIESTSAFGALVDSLNDQGVAQGPDSDYEGWANGEYLLDAQGAKIADGKGGYYWAYRYTADTGGYLSAVVQQTLLAVRDDATLEGIRFETPYARVGGGHGGAYSFDDENWRSGCRVTLESINAAGPSPSAWPTASAATSASMSGFWMRAALRCLCRLCRRRAAGGMSWIPPRPVFSVSSGHSRSSSVCRCKRMRPRGSP